MNEEEAMYAFFPHGWRCVEILADVKARLGAEYFTAAHHGATEPADVEFELTPEGHSVIHYRGTMFFRDDDGDLIAARTVGGRAEFAQVGPDGEMCWLMAPLAPAGLN